MTPVNLDWAKFGFEACLIVFLLVRFDRTILRLTLAVERMAGHRRKTDVEE